MPGFIKSSNCMTFIWTGSAVMGAAYLIGLWDGHGSPAFIVSQIVLGIIGAVRERYIRRQLVS